MGVIEVVGLGLGAAGTAVLAALLVEVRRVRVLGEEIRRAVEAQRGHREEVFERGVRVLRAALDEGEARAVVFGAAGEGDGGDEEGGEGEG